MKIDIIGSVASGKTTLASILSSKYNIPYYQKDNIVWERTKNGDVKRSDEDRDNLFRDILCSEHWIVEGSPRKCLHESYPCCDYIIFLDVNTGLRLKRVMTRWIKQRSGKEKYNSKPTFKFLLWNIKWVLEFNKIKLELMQSLTEYGDKYKVFKNQEQALAFVESVYGKEMLDENIV